MNPSDLTWKCELCREERPDKYISVLTYEIDTFRYAERNLKYCNDRPECMNKALDKAATRN